MIKTSLNRISVPANTRSCPVCLSENTKVFMQGIFDSDTTNVLECLNCELQFLDPIMSDQEEDEYYKSYYKKQGNRHFKDMNMQDLQDRALQHYQQYEHIYSKLISDSNSILEIGSGSGGFLRFVKENFPNTKITAIERCEENIKFLRESFGEKTYVVNDMAYLKDHKFDLIVAFGVFEHIRESRDFLSKVRKHLTPEGVLALNIPNKHNALVYSYWLDEFRKFTYMKQHYYTFTEKSIDLLAQQTGYKVHGFNYMQVWGLDNHLSWLRYRKPRDYSDISHLLSPSTLKSYNQDLISKKLTDLFMTILVVDPSHRDANQISKS